MGRFASLCLYVSCLAARYMLCGFVVGAVFGACLLWWESWPVSGDLSIPLVAGTIGSCIALFLSAIIAPLLKPEFLTLNQPLAIATGVAILFAIGSHLLGINTEAGFILTTISLPSVYLFMHAVHLSRE